MGKQAGQSLTSIKEGVQQETEYITQRINNGLGYVQQGPKHVQSVLARLQKRIEETRLQALLEVSHLSSSSIALYTREFSLYIKTYELQAERDAPVDVQIGPQLVEEAPQELRSRLWLALIDNPQLCHTYDDGKVLQYLIVASHPLSLCNAAPGHKKHHAQHHREGDNLHACALL